MEKINILVLLFGLPIALIITIINQTMRLRREKEEMLSLERAKERRPSFETNRSTELNRVNQKPKTRPKAKHIFLERLVTLPVKRIVSQTNEFLELQTTRYEVYSSGEYGMEAINGDLIIRAERCSFPNLTTITGSLSVDARECGLEKLKQVEGDVNIHYPVQLDQLDEIRGNLASIVDLELKNEPNIGGQIFTKNCEVIIGGFAKRKKDRRVTDLIITVRTQLEVDQLPRDGFFNLLVESPAIVIPHTHIYGSVSVQSDDVLFPYLEYIGKDLSYLPTHEADVNLSFPVLKKISGRFQVKKCPKPFLSVEAIGEILNSSIYRYPNLVHLGKHNFLDDFHTPKLSSISTLVCTRNFERRYHDSFNQRPLLPHLLSIRNLVCGKEVKDLNRVLKTIVGKKKTLPMPTNIYFEVLRLDPYTVFLSNERAVINNSWKWYRNFDFNSDVFPLAAMVSLLKAKHPTFEAFKENELQAKWPAYESKAFQKIIRSMEQLWREVDPVDPVLTQDKGPKDLPHFKAVYLGESASL
ncbi:hypothetical protein SAMN05660841_04117 [Sphingobacterium nematocida]|uniref:Uncharacterized protein n=1 Tax=Sphingobacterium nematocida TaxID=1513896 RepID=A0A1T5GJ16_9SPHI|nr:hypothetical protein [Sphingobacterium nematocida]SKC08375.1 hypothetical protein SAMN05660841_04117 [Sphingobacterium nematocida]